MPSPPPRAEFVYGGRGCLERVRIVARPAADTVVARTKLNDAFAFYARVAGGTASFDGIEASIELMTEPLALRPPEIEDFEHSQTPTWSSTRSSSSTQSELLGNVCGLACLASFASMPISIVWLLIWLQKRGAKR